MRTGVLLVGVEERGENWERMGWDRMDLRLDGDVGGFLTLVVGHFWQKRGVGGVRLFRFGATTTTI